MMENILDNYNNYISSISKGAVTYNSALQGRQIIYCSLKRFELIKESEDSDKYIQVSDVYTPQKEGENIFDYRDRRNDIPELHKVLKDVYPNTTHLEPASGIEMWKDPDGLTRIEIDEDYEYYKLWANIIKGNQTPSYMAMDNNLQIILPKIDELTYKQNDKVIFEYEEMEYLYSVVEPPEMYLKDIFQLNLKLMKNRPIGSRQ